MFHLTFSTVGIVVSIDKPLLSLIVELSLNKQRRSSRPYRADYVTLFRA